MVKRDLDYYADIYEEVKSTYENWGIDMMSMYSHIEEDCPNAAEAIKKMYGTEDKPTYNDKALHFDNPQYVYELIANLIPDHGVLDFDLVDFDLRTRNLKEEFKSYNMCSWHRYVKIGRIDLIMAILLFTENFVLEEFILNESIKKKIVVNTDNKLVVYDDYLTFKISKCETKTFVSIRIRGFMLLEYIILN